MNRSDLLNLGDINGFKNPIEFFDLGEVEMKITSKDNKRFCIEVMQENMTDVVTYVYASDLEHPIYKIYISSYKSFYEEVIKLLSGKLIQGQQECPITMCDFKNFSSIAKNPKVKDFTFDQKKFDWFIGYGIAESFNANITTLYHRNKISSTVFTNLSKELRGRRFVSTRDIINTAFKQMSKFEIISQAEKKLIFQKILCDFILNSDIKCQQSEK